MCNMNLFSPPSPQGTLPVRNESAELFSGELHVDLLSDVMGNASFIVTQDDSRIISYSCRMETSKTGAGYYPTALWGGRQTPTLFQFCPSRTYGKIRVLRTLRLAPSAPRLLRVISMDMQWNGAWILPEPALLCWAPSFPHRNEKKKKKKEVHGSTPVVASQMAESTPPPQPPCGSSESRPHKIYFFPSCFLIAFGGLVV